MNAAVIALGSAAALYLGYRFYGRFICRHVYGAGDLPDESMPSREREDGVDFVPTRRSVLFGHHYVTIAGAGPIVGPAIAVTWGWLPALLWVVLGAIFIGAVHDLGALVASVRNKGRTIGDLAADIMTPRVRLLLLIFISMALWVVLAVFGFVIAGLFTSKPESVLAIWVEIPLALLVGHMVSRRGGSMLLWSLIALVLMYVAIGVGMLDPIRGLFAFGDHALLIWLIILFVYAYVASVLPITKLLQPRDYINSHQLFLALGLLLVGLAVAPFLASDKIELVAPAVNRDLPADATMLYPFLFITIACGAISGFHCMVASGTTARQLSTERDAHAIGYGAMILEGGLAVVVILCCVSAAGFSKAEWFAHYSASWVGGMGLIGRITGFIEGGAGFIGEALAVVGITNIHGFLTTVIAVVVISFAATTMDSATRIQRYVISEIGGALGWRPLRKMHLATGLAVFSAAALAIGIEGPKGIGSGGMMLWPIFGVTNQLLACLTFLILNTWLAKRGRPIIYTTIPMLFLLVTVSWAGVSQLTGFAAEGRWPLVFVLAVGLGLEAWMVWEGLLAFKIARRAREQLRLDQISVIEAQLAMAGPTGAVIGDDGIIRGASETDES